MCEQVLQIVGQGLQYVCSTCSREEEGYVVRVDQLSSRDPTGGGKVVVGVSAQFGSLVNVPDTEQNQKESEGVAWQRERERERERERGEGRLGSHSAYRSLLVHTQTRRQANKNDYLHDCLCSTTSWFW